MLKAMSDAGVTGDKLREISISQGYFYLKRLETCWDQYEKASIRADADIFDYTGVPN